MRWTTADLPRLDGRVVVVTGATSGLGLETTRALAAAGARVVLATRSAAKTAAVIDEVDTTAPGASLEHLPLDLADLQAVRAAAAAFLRRFDRLDRLVNNAGVMAAPKRTTAQGHELQLGHGHHPGGRGRLDDRQEQRSAASRRTETERSRWRRTLGGRPPGCRRPGRPWAAACGRR